MTDVHCIKLKEIIEPYVFVNNLKEADLYSGKPSFKYENA